MIRYIKIGMFLARAIFVTYPDDNYSLTRVSTISTLHKNVSILYYNKTNSVDNIIFIYIIWGFNHVRTLRFVGLSD